MAAPDAYNCKWARPYPKRENAKLRVFAFPYAGGSGQEYQQWHKILSDDVEICCVLMPGRSVRMKDAVVSTMTQLVEEFIESVSHLLDQKPFVFFGHSMGSFVALEVARELRRRGKPMPVRIFASGAADPPVWVRRAKKEAEMSNADMTQLIAGMGGTPKEILENEDIMELMVIPVMRADWAVLDRYQYVEDEPLDIPITVLRGNEDTVATEAQQMHWQLQTSNEFDYHVFSGDHFFLKPKEREVLKVVYDHIKNHIV